MKKMLNVAILLGLLASQFSAPSISHAQEPTATPAPVGTAAATDTATEPSATETPIPTTPPTGSSQTPIATTAVETPTAARPATATVVSTEVSTQSTVVLSMTPSPQFVTPGGKATLHWSIQGIDPAIQSLLLQMVLPDGIEPIQGEGVFDEASRTLSIKMSTPTGEFHLSIGSLSASASFDVVLIEAGQVLASTVVSISTQEEFVVGQRGGTVSAMGGKVKIVFPSDVLPEQARITISQPDPSQGPASSLSGHAFQIKAEGMQSGADLHHFGSEVEIQANYAAFGIEPGHENDLYVWWYNPDTGDWEALLSNADPETGIVSGFTDHFSTFDISIEDWEAHDMPSVDAFQVAGFTGAATYQLPIEAPEGPGGLKPDLSLSYNSQMVDQSTLLTQPGWVGMGWSLDMPSITVDDHGDNTTSNDSWLLDVGGVTGRVVKLNDGTYHDLDEKFYKIVYTAGNDTWTIWDKTGNVYYFEAKSQRLVRPACGKDRPGPYYVTYAWSLSRLRNIFGQELQYAYTYETKTVGADVYHSYQGKCMNETRTSYTAMYPSTITYPGGRQRIRFELEPRTDYTAAWVTDHGDHRFMRSRLHAIYMEADLGGGFATTRKYVLTYASDNGANITFPGHAFSQGGKASTLVWVQTYGTGGTALPTTTFTYDGLHLTAANNGYGGSVSFIYETTPWVAEGTATQVIQNTTTCLAGWSLTGSGYIGGTCKLRLRGTAVNATLDTNLIRPGGAYRISATLYGDNPYGLTWQVGLDGSNNTTPQFGPSGSVFIAPIASSRTQPMLKVQDDGSHYLTFDTFTYEFMPAYYRVTEKTYSDGQGNSYTYEYSYEGAAVNNASNSLDCGTSCTRYFPFYTEFRGHSQVTETGPDGKQKVTAFYQGNTSQGDALKGRPISVTVKDGSGNVLTKTIYTYDVTSYPDTFTQPTGFGDVKRYWVTPNGTEARAYQNDGQHYSATQTIDTYDDTSYYGNLTSRTEQECVSGCVENGSPSWTTYRTTYTGYFPNAAAYLVGLPAHQTVLDAAATPVAQTLYLYDNAATYDTVPTVGKLTAIRSLASVEGYSQVDYSYDSWGNRTTVTSYSGYGTAATTPSSGSRTSYTCYGGGGTLGGQTCTDDSFHAYPLWTRDPLEHQTSIGYDYLLGLPTSETDANGAVTSAGYDSFGRITSITRPLETGGQSTLTMSYVDTSPFTTTITQRVDATHTYAITRTYDGMGRQIHSEAGGVSVDYGYDAYGRVVSQSVPYSGSEGHFPTTTTYDVLGRPTLVTAPDGSHIHYVYNEVINEYGGLNTTLTDANGHETSSLQDARGNVRRVDPPTGPQVSYTYDVMGRLLTATRGTIGEIEIETTMTYDYAGRKTAMTDPDMGTWSYAYDALGNLTSQTDALNCTLTMTYDDLSRLHTKTSAGPGCGTQVSTTYNYDEGGAAAYAVGRRTSMTSGTVGNSWTYDARGRVVSSTVNAGTPYTTGFTYDSADLPTTMTYPGGEMLTYGYDARMLLESLTNGTISYASSTLYDSAGRLRSRTLGNGLAQTFDYYAWDAKVNYVGQGGRLVNILTGAVQDLNYTYDEAGNIKEIRDDISSETSTYGYDTLDRLTSWALNGTSQTYTYDTTTGNLATKGGTTLAYEAAGHAHAVSGYNGNTYSYDANGNMTQRVIGSDTYSLLHDAENRLVEVKKNNVTMATFVYDGDGNRVKSSINGTTTTFVGNYYETDGSTVTKYYYAGSSRIAMNVGGTVYYLLTDQLGSTSITTSSSGTKVAELRYDAWGQVRFTSGATPTKYTYTGQYSNMNDFGLMYYNARWYDPTIARFTQADTIVPGGVQGYDRYAYTLNNPIRYTDPSGHAADQGGSTAARWEDLFEAYRKVAERTTYRENNGWRKEYLSTVAAYYHTRTVDAPNAVVEDMLGLVQDKKAALLINGYDGVDSAVSTAFDLSGFDAIGIATVGSNLVGVTVPGVHGNSLESPRSTVLYELVDSTTGEHLKFGITSESNPLDRYSRDFMKDKRMIILDQGLRRDMYELEQSYILNNPRGPLQFNNH